MRSQTCLIGQMPLLTRPILQVEAQREQGLPKVMLLGVLAQEVDLLPSLNKTVVSVHLGLREAG